MRVKPGGGVLSTCIRLGFDPGFPRTKCLLKSVEDFRKKYANSHSVSLISNEMMIPNSTVIHAMAATFMEHGIPEDNIAPAKSFWEASRGKTKLSYPQHKEMILTEVGNLMVCQNMNLYQNRHRVKWLWESPVAKSSTADAEQGSPTDGQGSAQDNASHNFKSTTSSSSSELDSSMNQVLRNTLALKSLVDDKIAQATSSRGGEGWTGQATQNTIKANLSKLSQGTSGDLPIHPNPTTISVERPIERREKQKMVENCSPVKRRKVLSHEVELGNPIGPSSGISTPHQGSHSRTRKPSTTNHEAIGFDHFDHSAVDETESLFEPLHTSVDEDYNKLISVRELRGLHETKDEGKLPVDCSSIGFVGEGVQVSQTPRSPLQVSSDQLQAGKVVSNENESSSVGLVQNFATSTSATSNSPNKTSYPKSTASIEQSRPKGALALQQPEAAIQRANTRESCPQETLTQDFFDRNAPARKGSIPTVPPTATPLPNMSTPTASISAAPHPVTPATDKAAPDASSTGVEVLLIHPTGARQLRWRGPNPLSDDVSLHQVFDKAEKLLRFQSIATLTLTLSILDLSSGSDVFSYESFVNKGDNAGFEWQKRAFTAWVAEKLDVLEEGGRDDDLKVLLALRPDADGIVEGSTQSDVGRSSKFKNLW